MPNPKKYEGGYTTEYIIANMCDGYNPESKECVQCIQQNSQLFKKCKPILCVKQYRDWAKLYPINQLDINKEPVRCKGYRDNEQCRGCYLKVFENETCVAPKEYLNSFYGKVETVKPIGLIADKPIGCGEYNETYRVCKECAFKYQRTTICLFHLSEQLRRDSNVLMQDTDGMVLDQSIDGLIEIEGYSLLVPSGKKEDVVTRHRKWESLVLLCCLLGFSIVYGLWVAESLPMVLIGIILSIFLIWWELRDS